MALSINDFIFVFFGVMLIFSRIEADKYDYDCHKYCEKSCNDYFHYLNNSFTECTNAKQRCLCGSENETLSTSDLGVSSGYIAGIIFIAMVGLTVCIITAAKTSKYDCVGQIADERVNPTITIQIEELPISLPQITGPLYPYTERNQSSRRFVQIHEGDAAGMELPPSYNETAQREMSFEEPPPEYKSNYI